MEDRGERKAREQKHFKKKAKRNYRKNHYEEEESVNWKDRIKRELDEETEEDAQS